jgi:hypothetical protein
MNNRSLKHWKYQLTDNYTIKTNIRVRKAVKTDLITLLPSGMLTIGQYYAWDGATWAIDTKSFMRGSLVHDALIQLINLELLEDRHRKEADKLLYQIALEDGMWRVRAWWVYKALTLYRKVKEI